MILGFDIGNTHICPICYDEKGNILHKFRIPTKLELTEDVLFSILKNLFDNRGVNILDTKDVVISSVVPHLNEVFIFLSKKYFNITPKYVSLKYLDETKIYIEGKAERGLGADRIVDILAAQKRYQDKYIIIIDFGTATTFEFIRNNRYLGGAILPGIDLSIKTLFENTAKLPKVRFEKQKNILANTTIDQINVGIYYSNIGAIKELISQYKKVINSECLVIATGGQGRDISNELSEIDEYLPYLGEEGIYEYYLLMLEREKNIKNLNS